MYLITGGGGFLGRNLAAALAASGKARVRIFDLRKDESPLPGVEYCRGDVTQERAVSDAVRGAKAVINLASLLPCSRAGKSFYRVNEGGTKKILEASFENGVEKFIHVSSSVVYGIPAELPLTETSPLRPIGDYGRSKLLAEDACREYAGKIPQMVILRPRMIIGPGRLGLLGILFDWIRRGKNIYTIGSGSNRFQMAGAVDVAEACMRVLERGGSGVYNIGSDNVPTVRDLLQGVIRHAGTRSRIIALDARLARAALAMLDILNLVPLGREHYLIGDKDYILDTSRAKRELAWVPRHSHEELMNAAYDWYIKNQSLKQGANSADFPREKALRLVKWFS